MKSWIATRVTWVWLLLLGITGIAWSLGHGLGFFGARGAGLSVLILAFVKVRLVLLDFMELRHAPRPLRLIAECWIVAICGVLLVLYVATPTR
jgi:hypothetical protein